jgi:1-acyl-sn-glycerol-3-phosphate acyltransferase
MTQIRAIIKSILFISWTVICLIASIYTYNFDRDKHERLMMIFFQVMLLILGIKISEDKTSSLPADTALFVSNHTSYLDIFVLGSKIPVRFTPKMEISKWPVINWLVNVTAPVYIDRRSSQALEQKKKIKNIIEMGDSILLFPESTTSDGRNVLPFKSSLFSAVEPIDIEEENEVKVQPISIAYTHIDGEPTLENNMDKLAWYGEMKFLPHLWDLFKAKSAHVTIKYLPEVYYSDFGSRKDLSKHCEEVITETHSQIRAKNKTRKKSNAELKAKKKKRLKAIKTSAKNKKTS